MTYDTEGRAATGPAVGGPRAAGAIAGVISGANLTGVAVAKASLLFSGPLAVGLPAAVTGALMGSAVMAVVLARRSTVPFNVAGMQDVPAAALVGSVAAVGALPALAPEVAVATAFAVVMGATLAAAAAFAVVGWLRLGRVVRFFPHAVIAGFLASTGWVLLAGGVLTVAPGAEDAREPLAWTPVALALATGVVLAWATRRVPHSATALVVLAGAGGLFWAALAAGPGFGVPEARAAGLLGSAPGAWEAFDPRDLALVDWAAVAGAVPTFGAVALLCLFAALLNVGAIEAETGHDVDADRELRATGLANLLAAPFGSPPGYVYVSMTSFAHRVGGVGREVGTVHALTLAAAVAAAPWMLSVVPPFVLAGLVVALGLDRLWDWVVEARARITRLEWGVVMAITAVAAAVDLLAAIGLGLGLSVVLFVWDYARAPVIRRAVTLAEARSTVERPPAQEAALGEHGGRVAVWLLQSYVFFGTIERVRARVRRRLEDPHAPPLERLVLDLRHVTGLDTASVAVLRRLAGLLGRHGAVLVLTRGGDEVARVVARAGEGGLPDPTVPLDDALAEAEEVVLAAVAPAGAAGPGEAEPLEALLGGVATSVTFRRGERLIAAGDEADHVLVLREGRVEVRAPGDGTRLRVLGPGSVIGDVAPYLDAARTADVVAVQDGIALRLEAAALAGLEARDPALALAIHRALARALARKVAAANRLVARTGL